MSGDSPSAYIAKVKAMFGEADRYLEDACKEFVIECARDMNHNAPGPGNQYSGTGYYAVGRLRGSLNFSTGPGPASVSRYAGGPLDETGDESVARIRAEIYGSKLTANPSLWYDVAYAFDAHEGQGHHTHIGPRPWVYDVSKRGQENFEVARARAIAKNV